MSQITRDINKITKTVIGVSGKLIVYALVILLLVEGIVRGYEFGHSIFYQIPMEAKPGSNKVLTVEADDTSGDVAAALKDLGLIENELVAQFQMKFYEYEVVPGTYTLNTSMTSKEMLQLLNEGPEEEEEEKESGR